jgi:hypothetical protein
MKKERQLLSNCVLHSKTIAREVELLLSKCLGEDVCSLFIGWTVLQIDDPIMYQLSDVVHMDLDVFGPLLLHWISTKLESTLIVTPNDSWMMKLDAKLGEEVLKPKCMNSGVDRSSILNL